MSRVWTHVGTNRKGRAVVSIKIDHGLALALAAGGEGGKAARNEILYSIVRAIEEDEGTQRVDETPAFDVARRAVELKRQGLRQCARLYYGDPLQRCPVIFTPIRTTHIYHDAHCRRAAGKQREGRERREAYLEALGLDD